MKFPIPVSHDVPLILAPMAGISESPFRQVCKGFGADIVVSEFISSVGLARGIGRVIRDTAFDESERPIGIQVYGADPDTMARAAAVVTEVANPDFIDINFGCPVKKVVRNNGGSGCLKDLELVVRIIRAVRDATHLPVTVKIRSGWDDQLRDPVGIAQRCEDAGAQMLTLHPRTRTQLYNGSACWEEIAQVVTALSIPVVGNGDIQTAEDGLRLLRETRCAGIMIARASFGNPWLFAEVRALLAGKTKPAAPSAAERFRIALEHADLALRIQGDARKTVLEFRKHLGWYTRGLPGAVDLRARLHQVASMSEAARIFQEYLTPETIGQAA